MDHSSLRERQLTLRFPPRRPFQLDDFVTGSNLELTARLRGLSSAAFQAIWITGGPCSGKSHLLQGACHAVAARHALVAYLPGRELQGSPDCFNGLDSFSLVAIDDLDALCGDRRVEETLLALYHGLAAAGGSLLIAADETPLAQRFVLADLASRLRAAQCFGIRPLTDDEKMEVARRYAGRGGLELPPDALRFLMQRGQRQLADLLALVDRLDEAALAAQRRVTVPFVKAVLGL
jgi:DnaA-homolog protein